MFEYLGKAYKKWTFPLGWGGGLETPDLPQNTKQGISLIISLRHTVSIFGWGDPSQLGSWSEGCPKPSKLSREVI